MLLVAAVVVGAIAGVWLKDKGPSLLKTVKSWWEQSLLKVMAQVGLGLLSWVVIGTAIYLVLQLAGKTFNGSITLDQIAQLGPVATATAAIVALVGVLWSAILARRTAKELESRSRREEVMRTMRWAAELACSKEQNLSELGVAELQVLLESKLLDDDQRSFVLAALRDTFSDTDKAVNEIDASREDDAEVIQWSDDPVEDDPDATQPPEGS